MPNILITYASRYGSTSEVAVAIAETARIECDVTVTLMPMSAFKSPVGYDGVIIGTAIYADQWLPDAEDYLYQFHAQLQKVPVAYFLVCMVAANSDPDSVTMVRRYYEEAANKPIKPVGVGLFAGMLNHDGLHGLEHWLVTVKHLPPGDYRDWNLIREWTIITCEALQDLLNT